MTWLYMVSTRKGGIYTGITNDLVRRIAEHRNGSPNASKYIKQYRFGQLIYAVEYPTRADAMRAERAVKGLSRQEKLDLATSTPLKQ